MEIVTPYVADFGGSTIRKITPAGEVTTFAGLYASPGSQDGMGNAARFSYPRAVATDAAGTVYVADTYNHTIRKITPAGVVSTLAGLAGSAGSADGQGSAARFYAPHGLAVDASGNIYVSDTNNHTIRRITPVGKSVPSRARPGSTDAAMESATPRASIYRVEWVSTRPAIFSRRQRKRYSREKLPRQAWSPPWPVVPISLAPGSTDGPGRWRV